MARTKYQRIVILTGAGISAESGIATFRDKGGLWERVNLDDVATPEAFARNPDFVNRFHDDLRRKLKNVQPNAAHQALARLEAAHPDEVLLVTQNVDDLHERAGSENIVHMHGELYKARCRDCATVHPWHEDLAGAHHCPACEARDRLRPHVVWFHEMPMEMPRIELALRVCDLFLSIGTSGNVYPAAGFVDDVRRAGRARRVELNLEPSDGARLFDHCVQGPATEVVPAFVDLLLAGEA